jgi:hypothetical protein
VSVLGACGSPTRPSVSLSLSGPTAAHEEDHDDDGDAERQKRCLKKAG